MTVLVTGGSGFIGRNLVTSLREAGTGVRVLDLEPFFDPAVETVHGDVADPEAVAEGLGGDVDAVVHLAAVTSVLRSVDQPELTHRTNVTGTAVLLEAARRAGVGRVVFASTNAVVGASPGTISEESSLRPLTPYGATKAAAEMLLSAYDGSYGIGAASLRFTNVYGPGMQAKDSIVARLMRAIRLGTTFEIYGDGRQLRDYLHVSDVVAAVRRALDDDRWHGPVVLGAGTSLSVLDVVEAVRRTSGASLAIRHGPAREGEMPAVVVDASRARRLGWTPCVELDEGLIGVWKEWSTLEPAEWSARTHPQGSR
jgi:UDP-glucose 4-epimerase